MEAYRKLDLGDRMIAENHRDLLALRLGSLRVHRDHRRRLVHHGRTFFGCFFLGNVLVIAPMSLERCAFAARVWGLFVTEDWSAQRALL